MKLLLIVNKKTANISSFYQSRSQFQSLFFLPFFSEKRIFINPAVFGIDIHEVEDFFLFV